MRIDKTEYIMRIAELVSTMSTCSRRQVGCVVVNEMFHIKATGFNGVPSGFDHCIDTPCLGANLPSGTGLDKCMATHAEQNALLQCGNVHGIWAIFATASPCPTCAKLICNTSCKVVYYRDAYSDTTGIDILTTAGIEVVHLK